MGGGAGFTEREETKFKTWEGSEGGWNLLKERKLNLELGRGPRGLFIEIEKRSLVFFLYINSPPLPHSPPKS